MTVSPCPDLSFAVIKRYFTLKVASYREQIQIQRSIIFFHYCRYIYREGNAVVPTTPVLDSVWTFVLNGGLLTRKQTPEDSQSCYINVYMAVYYDVRGLAHHL